MGAGPYITCPDCGQRHTWGPTHLDWPGPYGHRPDTGAHSPEHFAAQQRFNRQVWALIAILIAAMLALAIFAPPTPDTCQPTSTLTVATAANLFDL